jgi:hypothetical protein
VTDSPAGRKFPHRGERPFILGSPPDLAGPDLSAVADAILEVDEPPRGRRRLRE